MKIGILTFHSANNFGAVLQALGLSKFLQQQGHDTEVINYCPDCLNYLKKQKAPGSHGFLRRLVSLISWLIRWPVVAVEAVKFETFRRRYLRRSQPGSNDPARIPAVYDACIIGSDQVWNRKLLSPEAAGVYQGDFPRKADARLIAYAASAGAGEPLLAEDGSFRKWLAEYHAVSARETTLQKLLLEQCRCAADLVVDPTLLVDRSAWQEITRKKNGRPYILLYMVNRSEQGKDVFGWVKGIASGHQMEARYLPSLHSMTQFKWYQTHSPQDFVDLFGNASAVITTSFHGCCFSVINHKPFYFLSFGDSNENRSLSLLNSLGLQDRVIRLGDTPDLGMLDYSEADRRLKILQESSRRYLLNSLSGREG